MKYIGLLMKGILIGFISIAIPGLSASTVAIILGVYYSMINSVSSILKDFKKSVLFLLVLIIGYSLGCLGGALIVSNIYNSYPLPLIFSILGLIIGSMPKMYSDLKVYKPRISNFLIMIFVTGALILYSYVIVDEREMTFEDMKIIDYVILGLVGFLTSVTLVVPGVDFAVVLISIGYYYTIVDAIAEITTLHNIVHNGICLGIFIICYGIGAFICSNVLVKLINKFEEKMRFVNMGFILASPVIVVRKCIIDNPNFQATYSNKQLALGIILLFFLSLFMLIFYGVAEKGVNDRAHKRIHMLRFFYMILSQPFKTIKYYNGLKRRIKSNKYTFEENYKYCIKLIDIINKGGRTYPIVKGEENIPKDTTMFVINHQSRYDGIGVLTALRNTPSSILALRQRIDHPFYKETFILLKCIYIDAENPRSHIQAIKKMTEYLKNGVNMIVFPEGGYDDNENNLQEFKSGALKSAYDANVSITPMVLYDAWKVYGISSLKKIYPRVHILKPIQYEEYKDMSRQELADYIKALMQKEIEKIEGRDNEIFIDKQSNEQQKV